MKGLLVFTIIFLFLFSISITQLSDAETPILSDQRHENSKGFSIIPPKNWWLSSQSDFAVMFISPFNQGFSTTCYLSIWVENTPSSLNEYYNAYLGRDQQLFNFSLINQSDTSVAGYPSKQIIYSVTSQNTNLETKDVFFVENSRGFIVRYTAVPQAFDTYLPSFEKSLETFKVNSESPSSTVGEFNQNVIPLMLLGTAIIVIGSLILVRHRKLTP